MEPGLMSTFILEILLFFTFLDILFSFNNSSDLTM